MKNANNKMYSAEPVSMDKVINIAIEKLAKISNDPSGLSGIPSGFHELDQLTSGWQDGNVIVVAGRPSMGKTSFATSMLKYIAVGKSTPCVYFCLETKAREVANRLIANYSDIPISGLMSGRLSPGDWEKFDKFTQEISTAPIYLDDQTFDIDQICDGIRNMVEHNNARIAIIDYIQLIQTPFKISANFTRNDELAYIMHSFKALAKELNIPIIVLSQMNRYFENRDQSFYNLPQLTDLRESGTIEDDADIVIFIHRPEYYHFYSDEKGNDMRGIAQIIIAKHRMGYTGQLSLKFEAKFARFSDIGKATLL